MGKLNTVSDIHCKKDNWESWLNLRHNVTECTRQAFDKFNIFRYICNNIYRSQSDFGCLKDVTIYISHVHALLRLDVSSNYLQWGIHEKSCQDHRLKTFLRETWLISPINPQGIYMKRCWIIIASFVWFVPTSTIGLFNTSMAMLT